MKKLISAFALVLLLVGISGAIEWHTANQMTVAWDANEAVVAPDVLKYGVYTKILPNGEPILIHEQDATVVTITFQAEGNYIVGVTSVRYVGGASGERLESVINWSDINGENTPDPFGARYWIIPDPPVGLRLQ
jgi:hypothetical protein